MYEICLNGEIVEQKLRGTGAVSFDPTDARGADDYGVGLAFLQKTLNFGLRAQIERGARRGDDLARLIR
jgi:hypothetical protein